jgi:4-alpha-glucanotransferase
MLEDALGVVERPNYPGTTDEWPNWRIALPASLENIERDERVLALARVLQRRAAD